MVERSLAGLAGGYIRKVTPVPIPNTVVKLAEPMILHQWESRSLPALLIAPQKISSEGLFLLSAFLVRKMLGYSLFPPICNGCSLI